MSSRPRLAEVTAEQIRAASQSRAHGEASDTDAPPHPGRISGTQEPLRMPGVWLDGLLTAMLEAPVDQGQDGVVTSLIGALEKLVPEVKVVIELPTAAAARPSVGERRHVFGTDPPKSDERVKSARALPGFAHERTIPLPGPSAGGTLHVASDDDILSSESSPHVQLMERAAFVIAEALARVRAEERVLVLGAEVRAAEAQIVQAEKLASFGQIAAGMVHELNNPLTSIAAYTDFLLRRAGTRESDDAERLRRIAESANRMLRLTRDLVSYARPSGDVPIAVEVNVVVDRALAFCEHELAGVTVERSFDAALGLVRGLPDQLAQVFVNLVTNACHAMAGDADSRTGRGSILRISTCRAVDAVTGKAGVSIVVEDTGSGIQKEHIELVFNPFFTTKGAGRGTGLGLSIVKNIVVGHGGHIRAESDPAVGTRFIVHLPFDSSSVPPVLGPSSAGG
jgi:two-component system, NtrC family, sensor kinase